MINLVPTVVVVLLVVCLSASSSAPPNAQLTEKSFVPTAPSSGAIIAKRLTNLWNRAKQFTNSENTFVGRCFGIAKKLQFVIPLIIFLLGVTVTTLKFLTVFSLKGLGILVLLLILNIGPIFAKFALLKSEAPPPPHYAAPPQTVHFHVHGDKSGHHHYETAHYEPEWSDRISEGLSRTATSAERTELLNLYRRLGFKFDDQSS